jgi:2-methylcitrate dehydratase PrpD
MLRKDVMTYTGALAKFKTSSSFESLPREVIDKVKMCIYHALACSFAGHHLAEPQIAINFLKNLHSTGRSTSLVDGIKGEAQDIAFVNAVLGHSITQEDMHLDAGHPGSMIIPVALAMGEETGCSGKEFMAAVAVGYEVMARVGRSMSSLEFFKKFRTSSFFGPYGTCAAAAKLMKLTDEQTVNALGMAASLSSGLLQFTVEGTGDFSFQNGFAARNGIAAAMLGKAGIQTAKSVLGGH